MVSARRCLECKVLFESINALNDHCALTAHPSKQNRCQPCNRTFTTPSGLLSHLGSVAHEHPRRTQISARSSQASHDGATQPALTTNNVEDLTQTVCHLCKLTFENNQLLFEHYRTSSRHPCCCICFQVFRKRKALKKHMAEYHSHALVLPVPGGTTPKSETQITITTPGYTPQPELLDDDDFVLVERSSPLLRTTPETPIPVTSIIPQTGNANAALPNGPSHIGLLKCPGCHRHFYPFSSFVIHIDSGECSSVSMSQRINDEINAFAVQLFRNLSVTSG